MFPLRQPWLVMRSPVVALPSVMVVARQPNRPRELASGSPLVEPSMVVVQLPRSAAASRWRAALAMCRPLQVQALWRWEVVPRMSGRAEPFPARPWHFLA
jgi:hypothetical protein